MGKLYLKILGWMSALILAILVIMTLAWYGKIGNDVWIGVALFLTLVLAIPVFMHPMAIAAVAGAGAASAGGPGGTTPGQGAKSAVTLYVLVAQGLCLALAGLIYTLFFLDYGFSGGRFALAGLILVSWGQYALVFQTTSPWPRRVTLGILALMTVGVLAVSVSASTSKFFTGRPFWSGETYKVVAKAEAKMGKNADAAEVAILERVSKAINTHSIKNDAELWALVPSKISRSDVATFIAIRDGTWSSVPAIAKNGVNAVPGMSGSWVGPVVALLILAGLLAWMLPKGGLSRRWVVAILVLALIGVALSSTGRNWVLREGEKAIRVYVLGQTVLPFTMATLTPGQKVIGCLPQGTWTFVGAKGSDPYYQFKKSGSTGALEIGYFERGGMEASGLNLPLREDDRHGALLVTSDVTRNVPTGQDVIVKTAGCGTITVTPNVEGGGKGLSLTYPKKVLLIFAHP